MSFSLKVLGRRIIALLDILSSIAWVSVAVYSIGMGLSKLFSDNSFSLGDEKVISLLDSKPIAIMYILCGVLILMFMWRGYKRNREENENK